MARKYKYLFGPVPSRRLGRSLGIDLIPFKTCSYNCIYCQIGETSAHTLARAEYVPTAEVKQELDRKLSEEIEFDHLTFSGSGEPTLHCGIGDLIRFAKSRWKHPVAVITNGSLLWMEEVRHDLLEADLVLPTLCSADPEKFEKIHRPGSGLILAKIIEGLVDFRKVYRGQIWLELFVVKGINDREQDMEALRPALARVQPDRIQLNTSVRIPSEEYALSVDAETLERLARVLGDKAEVIAEFQVKDENAEKNADEQDVLNYLKRRPGTVSDISVGLGISPERARQLLRGLLGQGKISSRMWQEREEYFVV